MKTILSSSATTFDFSLILFPQLCPSKNSSHTYPSIPFSKRRRKKLHPKFSHLMFSVGACIIPTNGSNNRNANSIRLATRIRNILLKQIANESETQEDISLEESSSLSSSIQMGSNFTGFQEDPMFDKLRTQLGVLHPIPSPPINRNIVGLFVFFFFVGVVFDKLWTSRKTAKMVSGGGQRGPWPQVPTSFSLFLEKDLQRKESVEWVNMVLGKLWKVYRPGIENWIIGLLQPVIDNLKKPDYVERVEIRQFSLGDEPLSVRNVERRTSRRVNDLHACRCTRDARISTSAA